MRNIILAVSATAMAIPVTFALPTDVGRPSAAIMIATAIISAGPGATAEGR